MGGRSSQRKGYRREREVVVALREAGLGAMRQPLSGALGGDLSGDLICEDAHGNRWRVEVKGRAQAPKVLEGWLGTNDALVVVPDRAEWRVWLRWPRFVDLITHGPGPSNEQGEN